MEILLSIANMVGSGIASIADTLYLTQTFGLIGDAVGRVWNSFEYALYNYPYIILLYVLIVIGLSMLHGRIRSSHRKVTQGFQYEIDRLFYQVSKELYTRRSEIQKFAETCEVVTAHKKQLFDPKTSIKEYSGVTEGLMSDIKYLEQLLNMNIIAQDQGSKLTTLGTYLQRSQVMYYALGNTLGVMTLGIYVLFQARL